MLVAVVHVVVIHGPHKLFRRTDGVCVGQGLARQVRVEGVGVRDPLAIFNVFSRATANVPVVVGERCRYGREIKVPHGDRGRGDHELHSGL